MWITKRDSLIMDRLNEIYISTNQPVSSAQLRPSVYCALVPRLELEKKCKELFQISQWRYKK
jgi:hypothetical protein